MIKRVFTSTINYDHPQIGMMHAFQGIFGRESVTHYDYLQRQRELVNRQDAKATINNEFFNHAVAFKPDWMWLQLQNTDIITKETLLRVRAALPKCVISSWMGDIRTEVSDYLSRVCQATHLTLTSSIGYLPLYERAGAVDPRYLQIGLDWDEDINGNPDWVPPFRVPEVVFIGNNYHGNFPGAVERDAAVRSLMNAGIDIGVVGEGWEKYGVPIAGKCRVKEQVHVWKRAKVAVSVNHFPDVAGYYSDRHLTALVSGTPVVARYIPLLEREFTDGIHLLVYRTEAELVAHVRTLLGNAELRKKIGRAGRTEVLKNHTWFSRITSILGRVEEIRQTL